LDGRVELAAEAPPAAMAPFAAALRRGPPSSYVSDMEIAWGEATAEFERFDIRPTV
jgi:acylphosphatase